MPDTKVPSLVELQTIAGRLATTRRHHPEGDHSELEAEVATARIERFVEKVLRDAPPLTKRQRAEIARIVRSHPGRTP